MRPSLEHVLGFQPTRRSRPDSRTGAAAILAGAPIFAGQAGELAFGPGSDAQNAVEVVLLGLGVAALVVAIWRLGGFVSTRIGRIGWRVCVGGVVLLGLFAVQTLVAVLRTEEIPENFVLFALGFLLLFIGLFVFEGAWVALGVVLTRPVATV